MFPEGRILDFLIVGIVALIVVGPKDLPILMRKVGRFVAQMRGMAAEFRASFDEMARQSELDELRKEVEALRTGQPLTATASVEAGEGMQSVFDDIHASLREKPAQMHPISLQQPLGMVTPEVGPVDDAVATESPKAMMSEAAPPVRADP